MKHFTNEVSATTEVTRTENKASFSGRRRIRKACALVLAFTLLGSGCLNQFIPAMNDNSSSVVVVEAATTNSSKKLTGESRIYVSNLLKCEICVKVNTEKGVNNLLSFLKLVRDNATKGRKVLSSVVFKQGAKYLPGITGKAVSATLALLISRINTDGVQRSAQSSISQIESLHKKYPSRGVKIYMSTGKWKISVQ